MVDQVCHLQARGICAAILCGITGVSKALLATERDIAKGKLRLLFTASEAIVGNSSRLKQMILELPPCIKTLAVILDEAHCTVYKCVLILFPCTLSMND